VPAATTTTPSTSTTTTKKSGLAFTGADVLRPVGVSLGAMGAGGLLLLATRRRQRRP
jgi:hypothetical protein